MNLRAIMLKTRIFPVYRAKDVPESRNAKKFFKNMYL